MLCYRDRTFCDFKDCDHFNDCVRAMNKEWQEQYNIICNKNKFVLPVCQYVDKPECYKSKEVKNGSKPL